MSEEEEEKKNLLIKTEGKKKKENSSRRKQFLSILIIGKVFSKSLLLNFIDIRSEYSIAIRKNTYKFFFGLFVIILLQFLYPLIGGVKDSVCVCLSKY